jgi:asparagine synthase (glutamine-hydrolysing)
LSGFIVIYNRDGSPASRASAEQMMLALEHRGPDGSDLQVQSCVALGHQHFRTTPEEDGERQPLSDQGNRFKIVFDGRLDNRKELLAALGLSAAEGSGLSDAALTLRAYERWQERCFAHLLGPFAVAIYDSLTRQVVCGRDALGDRTLFYYVDDHALVIASEEQAVLAHPSVSSRLEEAVIAQFYAMQVPTDGRTFFSDVRELLPAHALVVDRATTRLSRYWHINLDSEPAPRSDGEYAEQFLALLTESVRCRLRSSSAPAVMLSGGLDSSSVAALAARELAPGGSKRSLTAVSWIFEELKECDERYYMNVLASRYSIDSIRFSGDDCWLLRDAGDWPWNPNCPIDNPFRRLKDRLYETAREAGVRTLLTGGFSDSLYTGMEYWLADLIKEHRFLEAWRQASRSSGEMDNVTSSGLRRLAGRALDLLPFARRLRPRKQIGRPAWLTPYAQSLLPEDKAGQAMIVEGSRLWERKSVTGALAARGVTFELFHTSRAGVEVRDPYRDRRLVEFMLSIPAHQLYNHGHYKYVLRNAMNGLLPEAIRLRTRPSTLAPLFNRGLLEREWQTAQALLNAPDAGWRKYVRAEWLLNESRLRSEPDGAEALVPWWCISMQLWRAGFEAREKKTCSAA